MKLVPGWVNERTAAMFDDKADDCITNDDCDPKLRVMQESIAKNAEKSHKWNTISEFARWATLFVLGGIVTALTTAILGSKDPITYWGGITALGAFVTGGATLAVAGTMIANRIYTQNQVNTSVFNARATAREIANLGREKDQLLEETNAQRAASLSPADASLPLVMDAALQPAATLNHAERTVESKGLHYLHTLMEPAAALQTRN